MAATTGLGELSIISWTSNRLAPLDAPPNSEMSAPAMNVRPPQIRTMAAAAGSAMAALNPSYSPSRTLKLSALTGGESMVRTATSPSRVRSATSLIVGMRSTVAPLRREPRGELRSAADEGDQPGLDVGVVGHLHTRSELTALAHGVLHLLHAGEHLGALAGVE